jgi:hypothetical protein
MEEEKQQMEPPAPALVREAGAEPRAPRQTQQQPNTAVQVQPSMPVLRPWPMEITLSM